MNERSPSGPKRIASIAGAAVGLALFIYAIRQAGFARIVDDMRKIGSGFFVILLLALVREVVRSYSWILCVDEGHRLRLKDALPARIIGEALGNLTPLGLLVSEPVKAVLVRDRLPIVAAFSALAVEQLLYALSVVIVIAAGMGALLASATLTASLKALSIATLASVAGLAGLMVAILRMRPQVAARILALLARIGVPEGVLVGVGDPARALETRLYGSFDRARSRVWTIGAMILLFHLAAIAEVYVTLRLITAMAPSLFDTFVLESVNRLITVAFKFVPLRLGVDEAGSGLASGILQLGTGVGVTLAIVRKARILAFSAVGIILLLQRGLTVRELVAEGRQAAIND
jgi:hypothetical protein